MNRSAAATPAASPPSRVPRAARARSRPPAGSPTSRARRAGRRSPRAARRSQRCAPPADSPTSSVANSSSTEKPQSGSAARRQSASGTRVANAAIADGERRRRTGVARSGAGARARSPAGRSCCRPSRRRPTPAAPPRGSRRRPVRRARSSGSARRPGGNGGWRRRGARRRRARPCGARPAPAGATPAGGTPLHRASPPSAATAARNRSPRSSKSRNWSKLAQAGASSTTSPGWASRAARPTARSSVPASCTGTRPAEHGLELPRAPPRSSSAARTRPCAALGQLAEVEALVAAPGDPDQRRLVGARASAARRRGWSPSSRSPTRRRRARATVCIRCGSPSKLAKAAIARRAGAPAAVAAASAATAFSRLCRPGRRSPESE